MIAKPVKLGLIGDNITSSSAPLLHKMAAAQHGFDLSYELIIPPERGFDFDRALDFAKQNGLRGVNVTLPYKEQAFPYAQIADPAVQKLGSVNTICFDSKSLTGFNTDYTGFLQSYRVARGALPAGHVLLIGAGGVGRSICFALAKLGASAITIFDRENIKAVKLADEVNLLVPGVAMAAKSVDTSVCDAVVNCTPAGMYGYGGLPISQEHLPKSLEWAFDAVYQPVDTPFKQMLIARGVQFISGFELFFYQGVDAFKIFTGFEVKDPTSLRHALFEKIH